MADRKEYFRQYAREHKEQKRKYYREYYKKNTGKWVIEHKEEKATYDKRIRQQFRTGALNILSDNNPHCVRCGCNDVRLLEINHKNGGGNKATKKGKLSTKLIRDICKGTRETNDLELLCRVCNAWHYLELKYGKLPYKINYEKEG